MRDCHADVDVTQLLERGHLTIYEYGWAGRAPCDAAVPILDQLAARGVAVRFVDVNDCAHGPVAHANVDPTRACSPSSR